MATIHETSRAVDQIATQKWVGREGCPVNPVNGGDWQKRRRVEIVDDADRHGDFRRNTVVGPAVQGLPCYDGGKFKAAHFIQLKGFSGSVQAKTADMSGRPRLNRDSARIPCGRPRGGFNRNPIRIGSACAPGRGVSSPTNHWHQGKWAPSRRP